MMRTRTGDDKASGGMKKGERKKGKKIKSNSP
jgi:hypothetical protein